MLRACVGHVHCSIALAGLTMGYDGSSCTCEWVYCMCVYPVKWMSGRLGVGLRRELNTTIKKFLTSVKLMLHHKIYQSPLSSHVCSFISVTTRDATSPLSVLQTQFQDLSPIVTYHKSTDHVYSTKHSDTSLSS